MVRLIRHYLSAFVIALVISGCAGKPIDYSPNLIPPIAVAQMNEVYSTTHEVAWCMGQSGISNVIHGTFFTVKMPLCRRSEIVFHSHCPLVEPFASPIDWNVWGKYRERYGNDLYGVMVGANKFLIYDRGK